MTGFFSNTRPGEKVEIRGQELELPALYFRDDLFMLFFSADADKVKALMPSDNLHPVLMPRGRATIGVACFNYIDTSLGPYGEVGIVVPVVYGKQPSKLFPLLMESRYPNFGTLVLHLPVTNTLARDGGRIGWGYTKFVADMWFSITPEYMEVRMAEEDRHILTARVERRGFIKRDTKPVVTYTVLNGELIKTVIPQVGTCRVNLRPKNSFVQWGDHEVARGLLDLGLSNRPLMTRYYMERSAILPLGQVVEKNVHPLDGYLGSDRDGVHEVRYME
jgi:hypothetical protein